MSFIKRVMFKVAGGKYDKMAAAKGQKYFFIFVHEDGEGLEKVASGGSKGKTILKIS